MAVRQQVTPSPEARRLFGRMVVMSDGNLHLSLDQTLAMGVELVREGRDPMAMAELHELQAEEWIDPSPGGGWLLH